MQKPRNIQLVTDGDGTVILIVDGKPEDTYFYEYGSLPTELEAKLCKYLPRYEPEEDE